MAIAIDHKAAAKKAATSGRFQPGNKIGPRFQKGHPLYPPKPVTRHHRQKSLQAIAKQLFRAIEEESGGELTVQQRIHAENAAKLGALAQDMFDSGKQVNLETLNKLIKSQQHELELMNE
jgi:hypothetical protein